MSNCNFNNYLEVNGFYFKEDMLENYLLSLKTKPFLILSGNSGTGKTKLSNLFANYMTYDNNEYYMIKVSTLKRSFSVGKKDNQVGWGIYKEYLENLLPIDQFNGKYEVEIGGYTTQANISLSIQLYYDYKNEEFRRYFKKLYEKEKLAKNKDNGSNKKRDQQMVYLGVSRMSIENLVSEDYTPKEEIILYPTLTKSVVKGEEKLVPFDIFDYMPFNKRSSCTITANGLFSEAHFEVKVRMRNYATQEIKQYLKKLYEANESHFELKIKGFKHDFKDFKLLSSDMHNYEVIPVGADWNDGSHILGFYNALINKYQYTPAIELIKRAQNNPNYPYFLILDEMNLAHVERYFAEFLSAIESGEEIPLYGNDKTLKLPKNLFIIGTVNVDDNNYKFLPIVLDRANVIELDNVPASEYMSFEKEKISENNMNYLQSPLMDCDISILNINDLKEILSNISYKNDNLSNILSYEITEFQNIVKNSSFEFNFRVINELLRFMIVAWRYENSPVEWNNWERYFDVQIKQKILPKLEGSEKVIGNILNKLFNLCLEDRNNNENPNTFEINIDNCRYYNSAVKLQSMSKALYDQEYASFI